MATIYILEDDLNIQEIEAYALKNSGYQTEGFDNAREFFKKVSERVPSLLLLDIMLPDADGLDVLRKLRSMPETKKLPIILVTAKTSEIDKVKGLDVGADDYITKPFNPLEVVARVKTQLRRCSKYNTSISSKESHTPKVGMMYFESILSAKYFLASYLSTIVVYIDLRSYNFIHCIFSLKVCGLSKFNGYPIY